MLMPRRPSETDKPTDDSGDIRRVHPRSTSTAVVPHRNPTRNTLFFDSRAAETRWVWGLECGV